MKEEAKAVLERGMEHFKKKKYDKVIKEFTKRRRVIDTMLCIPLTIVPYGMI